MQTVSAQTGNDNPTGLAGGFSGMITTGGSYDPYTASASRTVVDLQVAGAVSSHGLAWRRTMNTRGDLWRSAYSYGILGSSIVVYASSQAELNTWYDPLNVAAEFPDGRSIVFSRPNPNDEFLEPPAGVQERLRQNPSPDPVQARNFYIWLLDGTAVHFERTQTLTGAFYNSEVHAWEGVQTTSYKLLDIADPFLRTTTFSYDSNGRLYRITDQSGRWLQCTWVVNGANVFLDKVSGWDGQWVDFDYIQTSGAWVLSKATYSDDTPTDATDNPVATYTYQASNVTGVTGPLPSICSDVRYSGPMRKIKYVYDTAVFGRIAEERIPASAETGNVDVMVSKYDPSTKTETRGDGTTADPITRQFTYSGYKMTVAKDFKGNPTTYGYDANGFRNTIKNALNQTTTLTRESKAGSITRITHPDGTFASIEYTDANYPYWVKKTTDELGRITTYTRDGNHRVTRIDYPVTADGMAYETFTYNGFGQVLLHRMTNGRTEEFIYNSYGQLTSHKDPLLNETTYAYDSNGRVLTVTDALGNPISFLYNDEGLITRITNPDNSTKLFTYDRYGNKLSERNELGRYWYYAYDLYNRLTVVKDPLNFITETSYLKNGGTSYNHTTSNAMLVTSPELREIETGYDKNFAPVSVTVGNSTTTSTSYDEIGQVETTTDAMGQVTVYTYDNRGRRLSVEDPLHHFTRWTYDAVGNGLTTKLHDNTVTTNTYDARNRVLTIKDPLNQIITMDYDLAGNLTTLTDKRQKDYSYTYDELNRQRLMIYPDTSYEQSNYDANGTLDSYRNRAGNTETYTYDGRKRLTQSDWNNTSGVDATNTYDVASQITDINGLNSALHYTYDVAGRQLSERQTISGLSAKTVSYSYDNDGNRETMTYPDGTVLDYTWTSRQLLAKIEQGANTLVTYSYNDRDQVVKRSLRPGNYTDATYDAAGRLDSLTHKRTTFTFENFDYGYNTVNNRTYVKRMDARGDAYTYDDTQQLTQTKYNALTVDTTPVSWTSSATYAYDPAGNRSSWARSGFTTTNYTAASNNTYSAIGGITPGYDGNRNMASWNGWTYTHDAENKLTAASKSGVSATFSRDPLSRIAKTVINGVTTYNIYDGWNIIARYNSAGAVIDGLVYGRGTDEIICRSVGSVNYYYQYDGLGNVSHIFNSSGALLESYTYDVYGAVTIKSPAEAVLPDSAIGNRYFFTGREYLTEIDLYDYRNRTYSAELGRFLEPDPLGFAADDHNLYRYCGNDPSNNVDPEGTAYNDLNFSYGFGPRAYMTGITGGLLFNDTGITVYGGFGFMGPGMSGTFMNSNQDVSPNAPFVQGQVPLLGPTALAGGFNPIQPKGSGYTETGAGAGSSIPSATFNYAAPTVTYQSISSVISNIREFFSNLFKRKQ